MKKILTMSLTSLMITIAGAYAATTESGLHRTIIHPDAIKRVFETCLVPSAEESVLDLDSFVLGATDFSVNAIYLNDAYDACIRQLKQKEASQAYKFPSLQIKDNQTVVDTDINGFCKTLILNIVREHNGIVSDVRSDILDSTILPANEAQKVYSPDNKYFVSKINLPYIDTSLASELLDSEFRNYFQRNLDNMTAVFNADDESLVCVMQTGYINYCKDDKDGHLFAHKTDDFNYFTREQALSSDEAQRVYGITAATFDKAPVGRTRFEKFIKQNLSFYTNRDKTIQVGLGF